MATIVVPVNKEITFTDTSTNLDTSPLYKWNFGDGSPEEIGKVVKHTYTTPAIYYPTHEVKNSCGTVYEISPQKTIEVISTPTSKYKCQNGMCIQDDINGTFLEPTCGNSCIPQVSICTWITSNGGIHPMMINNISTLIRAYLGYENVGFVVSASYISGVISYYLNNLSSGNSLTGCNFT